MLTACQKRYTKRLYDYARYKFNTSRSHVYTYVRVHECARSHVGAYASVAMRAQNQSGRKLSFKSNLGY